MQLQRQVAGVALLSPEGIERRQVELIVEYLREQLPAHQFSAFLNRLSTGRELHHVGPTLVRANPDIDKPEPPWRPKQR